MEAPTAVAAEEHFPGKDLQNIHPVSVKNWSAGMLHVVITCLPVFCLFHSWTDQKLWKLTSNCPISVTHKSAM